jgi:hypothetical protein
MTLLELAFDWCDLNWYYHLLTVHAGRQPAPKRGWREDDRLDQRTLKSATTGQEAHELRLPRLLPQVTPSTDFLFPLPNYHLASPSESTTPRSPPKDPHPKLSSSPSGDMSPTTTSKRLRKDNWNASTTSRPSSPHKTRVPLPTARKTPLRNRRLLLDLPGINLLPGLPATLPAISQKQTGLPQLAGTALPALEKPDQPRPQRTKKTLPIIPKPQEENSRTLRFLQTRITETWRRKTRPRRIHRQLDPLPRRWGPLHFI